MYREMQLQGKRVAIVTDWLTNLGGAERVVAAVADIFPDAPIYTTFLNFEKVKELFPDKKRIRPSIFSHIPSITNKQIFIAPFLKTAISSLNLKDFDIILSFSSSVAKNIRTHKNQTHICYIHTPARYIWQKEDDNRFEKFPIFMKPLVNLYLNRLKKWDLAKAASVDFFISNSRETASRVKKFYARDSEILYPPVDFDYFQTLKTPEKGDYFLAFGRFVKYKRFDLVIEAFKNLPDKKLVLAGDGPEKEYSELLAKGVPNIEFLGRVERDDLKKLLNRARALILPQKEDAGIVQLESLSCGVPVIAYKDGGALDVIRDGKNGVFFDSQNPQSLVSAIQKFEKTENSFNQQEIKNSAETYSLQSFQRNYLQFIEKYFSKKGTT